MGFSRDWTRRTFLQTVGAGVPTVKLMLSGATPGAAASGGWPNDLDVVKFTPIDLSTYFAASPSDFGPRERAKGLSTASAQDGLIRTLAGKQSFRGIPFLLGPEGVQRRSWVVLSNRKAPWVTGTVEIPLNQKAGFICFAQFSDWDPNETPPPDEDLEENVAQHLADVVLIFEDGSQEVQPIRRRFEMNSPSTEWGHLSFAALAQNTDRPAQLADSLPSAMGWGDLQQSVLDNSYSAPVLWICALANPHPDRTLKALRLQAVSDDPVVLCGLTLFHGSGNPLRYERLTLYRITLPEPVAGQPDRWTVDVDLGVVARTSLPTRFEPESWLSSSDAGLGSRAESIPGGRHLYAELAASSGATLRLRDVKAGKEYVFDLSEGGSGQELEPRNSSPRGTRIEILEREKVWLHGQAVDAATGRPTPVRLAFRSKEGRYIPPYGHRTEINDGWF